LDHKSEPLTPGERLPEGVRLMSNDDRGRLGA
jgi:hypothetical protein